MVRVITVDDVRSLIRKVTLETFYSRLIEKLEENFSHWQSFEKIPRIVTYFDQGVIELMPLWGKDYYSFKYINGHPGNPKKNKQTIAGVGMLADVDTGYPVLISEMTLLTALRTAATSAMAMKYLAKPKSKVLGIIGTGAQSEFQVMAIKTIFDIELVKYIDLDANAMNKFSDNLSAYSFQLEKCSDISSVVKGADIITTITAARSQSRIFKKEWIKSGMTINAVGGDSKGKTELEPEVLDAGKVVIEFMEQSKHEGEIQNYDPAKVYAELWELTSKKKPGRTNDNEIFIYDSVGFAIEDYTILKLVYSLAEDFHVGHMLDIVPELKNPKNLFGALR